MHLSIVFAALAASIACASPIQSKEALDLPFSPLMTNVPGNHGPVVHTSISKEARARTHTLPSIVLSETMGTPSGVVHNTLLPPLLQGPGPVIFTKTPGAAKEAHTLPSHALTASIPMGHGPAVSVSVSVATPATPTPEAHWVTTRTIDVTQTVTTYPSSPTSTTINPLPTSTSITLNFAPPPMPAPPPTPAATVDILPTLHNRPDPASSSTHHFWPICNGPRGSCHNPDFHGDDHPPAEKRDGSHPPPPTTTTTMTTTTPLHVDAVPSVHLPDLPFGPGFPHATGLLPYWLPDWYPHHHEPVQTGVPTVEAKHVRGGGKPEGFSGHGPPTHPHLPPRADAAVGEIHAVAGGGKPDGAFGQGPSVPSPPALRMRKIVKWRLCHDASGSWKCKIECETDDPKACPGGDEE